LLAGHDLSRGEIHRIEPRCAKTVDLHAGDAVAIASDQSGRAGDIGSRFADGIDNAHNHVVD
jgi:hypothetical protein